METNGFTVRRLTYCGVSLGVAAALSMVKVYEMPQGGTVTACSMIFVSLIGYLFGAKTGLLAAAVYGLIQFVLEPVFVHPAQVLLDYLLAFGALGVSGFFKKGKNGLLIGYLLGAALRLVFTTISGMVFFWEYAGDTPVWWYSLSYNMSYIVPEAIVTAVVICVPAFKAGVERVRQAAGGLGR